MALLPILHFPDPRLRTVARPVSQIDARVRQIAADMAETMYDAPGIGLAATQVDIHERIVVIDLTEDRTGLRTLINPEIVWRSDDTQVYEEGCLSVPSIYDKVTRSAEIRVRYQNLQGDWVEEHADGLLAVCIQHELDHLAGKVFVDHLSGLKQERIKTKLRKQQRAA